MRTSALFLCLLFSSLSYQLHTQTGKGVMLNTPEAFDGYILFETQCHTYIVDNCGEVINTWFDINETDNHTKLLDNGNMMYIRNNAVYEVDWDGNIQNSVTHGQFDLLLEYEVILMPNGNYLCLARRSFSQNQFFDLFFRNHFTH